MTDSPSTSTPDCECDPIDCSFPKVVACRVGASVSYVAKTGHFGPRNRGAPQPACPHRLAPGLSDLEIPRGKLRVFTLEELERATNRFNCRHIVGRGGFGDIYKGILSDGSVVAVKVRREKSSQGTSEFLAEIQAAERIRTRSDGAKHLLAALGYCHLSKKKEVMMIVYPFRVYGDLGSYLDVDGLPRSRAPLDWPTRIRIALEVARGISCLHELRILHCDIKPSNIMLDEYFEAYVGDFGLAKVRSYDRGEKELFLFEWDSCDCRICGTLGYIAPELASDCRYSRRSDVYAFGATLAHLIMGKMGRGLYDTEEYDRFTLVGWVEDLHKNKKLDKVVDPEMGGVYNESELDEMIKLSLVCTQDEAKRRPYMSEVVSILEVGGSEGLRERWERYEYREWPNHEDRWTYEWDSMSTVTRLPSEELSGPR
ncbi:hypothetical protein MLD38_004473 [Melastoma candidum]|uniref:Uncharacterized protein n=1 Tax=Melastoma candidum TaxID=119954 RepID=A0ACB9S7R5_9MYRT|nr:hypothetical protein MLD38_004473 [Melastoma candidum]